MFKLKSPWNQNEKEGSHFSLGIFLWLGFLVFVVLFLWALFVLFPDQSSSGDDVYLEVVQLVGILALVSSGLVYVQRIKFGEVIRNISIWTGLVSILLLGYTYRTELSHVVYLVGGELIPGQAIVSGTSELMITASDDNHFYVNGKANGKRVRFLIDTGASEIVLSPRAAERIGVDLETLRFTQQYQTANGIGFGANHWLESFSIGSFKFSETKVSINQSAMSQSLLGMSFLKMLKSFEFRGDKLYLRN